MLTLTAPVLDAGTTYDPAANAWVLHLHLGRTDNGRPACVARVRYSEGVAPEHQATADQRRALQSRAVTVTATRWSITPLALELDDAHLVAVYPPAEALA
jgi:hypothetical protein